MEKSSDADLWREMIGFAAERLMELEGAGADRRGYGEHAAERWCSATATATGCGRPAPGRRAAHPQAQEGQLLLLRSPGAARLPGRVGSGAGQSEKALTAVSQETYVHGISTRSVDEAGRGARHCRHRQACPRAGAVEPVGVRSAACARRSTSACAPFSSGRSRATGTICGSTPPRSGRRVVAAFIATAFTRDNADAAKAQWRQVADQVRTKLPKLAALLDAAEVDVLAYMNFPKGHRAKIHSTDPLERLKGEVTRRTEGVGIFRNEAAITRLSGRSCSSRTTNGPCSGPGDMTPGKHRALAR